MNTENIDTTNVEENSRPSSSPTHAGEPEQNTENAIQNAASQAEGPSLGDISTHHVSPTIRVDSASPEHSGHSIPLDASPKTPPREPTTTPGPSGQNKLVASGSEVDMPQATQSFSPENASSGRHSQLEGASKLEEVKPHPNGASSPHQIQANVSSSPKYTLRYIMSGHTRSISSIKFNPHGTKLASAAADKLLKVWDPINGHLLHTFEGHTEGISDVAWSSDGEFLATASDDKTIRIWSMETGEVSRILKGHTNFVFCVNYNPQGNLLASGGFDETVKIWDVARAKPLRTLPAHSDPVTAVTFNHDGTLIASCSMDGLIRLWDTDSGQCLKTLADDDNPICSHIKFSPNSKYILASTQDSTIRLWNVQSSRCVKTYTGHTNRTYSVFCDFAPGGSFVVSGSEDCKIYLWHLQTRQIAQVLEGHRDVVIALASNPRLPMIASASVEKDLTIHIWVNDV